jgi:hypothetical protein
VAVLPAEIPTGLVTGQFYFVNEDNVDANTDPELTVVTGTVTFTCSAKVLRMPTKLATLIPLTFDAEFDSNGNLVPKGRTDIGIELPATDSADLNPTGFTWKVEFDLKEAATNFSVVIPSFDIQVPVGTAVDLTTVMPVDTSPGVLTIQGPQGVAGDQAPVVGPANISGTVTLVSSDLPSTRLRTLTGNVTFVLPTPSSNTSGTVTLVLTQDATGGRTITWPASVKWPDGIAQQPAAGANTLSVIHLLWTGANWLGMLGGKSFA